VPRRRRCYSRSAGRRPGSAPQLKRDPLGSTDRRPLCGSMPVSKLLAAVLLTWLVGPLRVVGQAQLPQADTAQYARARALCGALADDSTRLDPLWPPAGSLASARFPGLEGLRILGATPVPEYPERLRKQRVQGTVIVSAIVDTTGRVEPGSIKVATTPHEDFVPAVHRYLKGVRFSPGRIHGRLMRVCVVMPISFGLPQR